jgi:hypothetical protein
MGPRGQPQALTGRYPACPTGSRVQSVFAPRVELTGFTATDWQRLLGLFEPRRPTTELRDPERPSGTVVAVHDRGALVKLVHTRLGRLQLDEVGAQWPLDAAGLARVHHASFSLRIERGALERVVERFGASMRRGQDLTEQSLLLAELLRSETLAGTVEAWPKRLLGVPIPTAAMVRTALDSVCPPGRAMVLGVFQGHELYTCVALRRASGVAAFGPSPAGFDRIVGPDELRDDVGILAGDWHRDHRHLARAAELLLDAPLALGVFSEVETLRRLVVDPSPGAWARAAALRDVVLHPVPSALALPLGLDATRAAASILLGALERVDSSALFGPTLSAVFERVKSEVPGLASGFRPLEILRLLLSRER